MSKIVCSAVACIAIGSVSASAASSKTNNGSTPNGQPFVEINKQFASIQDQIDELIGRVDTLEGKSDALVAMIEELQEKNIELEELIGQNRNDSEAVDAELQAQIDNNLRLITAMQADIEAIKENMEVGRYIEDRICPSNMDVLGVMNGQIVCANKGSSGKRPVEQYSVYTITSIEPGQKKGIHSHCRKGDILSGGGYHEYWNVEVSESRPHSPAITPELGGVNEDKAWYVVAKNHGTFTSYVYSAAQCLKFY